MTTDEDELGEMLDAMRRDPESLLSRIEAGTVLLCPDCLDETPVDACGSTWQQVQCPSCGSLVDRVRP